MSEYKFDAVRWCKSRARSARAQRNFADENSFVQVARELERLSESVPTQWAYDQACAALQKKTDELAALKAAGRDVVAHWVVDNIQANEGAEESIREFARLCGEGQP